jgi:hypothetical protein
MITVAVGASSTEPSAATKIAYWAQLASAYRIAAMFTA